MHFYLLQDFIVVGTLKTGRATGYNITTTKLLHCFLLGKNS